MVKKAPLAFIIAFAVGVISGYLVSNTRFEDRIAYLDSQLDHPHKDNSIASEKSGTIALQPASIQINLANAITPTQQKTISEMIFKNKDTIGTIHVGVYYSGSNIMYSLSIIEALQLSGADFGQINMNPEEPTQTGLMIACDDPNNLTAPAKTLKEAFEAAGLSIRTTKMLNQAKRFNITNWMLFIGPRPQ